ncbi:MAG TPA: hypothetical protein VD813_14210 [Pseudonocardia sp.]|nr:hypothetical protein [Pseudonocardia sp.]
MIDARHLPEQMPQAGAVVAEAREEPPFDGVRRRADMERGRSGPRR